MDINAIKSDLRSAPYSVIIAFDDVNDVLSAFEKLFIDIWDAHALVKTTRRRKKIVP